MPQSLEASTLRILNTNGLTVGTGFMVAPGMAVTCAHVIDAAGGVPGESIEIQFYLDEKKIKAQVLEDGWSPEDANDIAFLRLEHAPDNIQPLVLGSAQDRAGHAFSALGFPESSRYQASSPGGDLGRVVPVKGDYQLLQLLRADEIEPGISGAPVLDLHSDRVVGIVTEYNDKKYTRSAFATPMDIIIQAGQAFGPRLWPDAYGPQELNAYLDHLIETYGQLTLPDGRQVPLERVYVSLRADQMNAAERQAEHDLYLEGVEAQLGLAGAMEDDLYRRESIMRREIVRRPRMKMLDARDWQQIFGQRPDGKRSLAEVVQAHSQVVILGDPGSGKSTLCHWLVMQFGRALREGQERVVVCPNQVQAGAEEEEELDLGPVRLPLLVRIAEYARIRWQPGRDGNNLRLEDFIGGGQFNGRQLPGDLPPPAVGALAKDALANGTALLILDGLDEVGDLDQRRQVMHTIDDWIKKRNASGTETQPGASLLLTSRIVGYQFRPLTHLPHYTVEEMDENAIRAFCAAWVQQAASSGPLEGEGAAGAHAARLQEAIFEHSHPGVRSLAGNPLLLTLLAQVYWSSGGQALPARRIELFSKTVDVFYKQRKAEWERSGLSRELLVRALGAVAADIHASQPSGFAERGDLLASLRRVLPDPTQVQAVLDAAEGVSGLLAARGQGVYGFLHRSLQEYFAACDLVAEPEHLAERLRQYALDPTWREPLALALGLISRHDYPGGRSALPLAFAAVLDCPDLVGDLLPRRELLAAAGAAECGRLPGEVAAQIAGRLLAFYADRQGRARNKRIRKAVQYAFSILQRVPQAAQAVGSRLCAGVQDDDFETRYAAIEIIIETRWDSPGVARALVGAYNHYAGPAGSTLVALLGLFERHPEYFQPDFLPLRAAVKRQPELWQRATRDPRWRALLGTLYLPPGAPFEAARIYHDSPLTPQVLQTLAASDPLQALDELRGGLQRLAAVPGGAQAAEAALVLAALDERGWIENWAAQAGEDDGALRPVFSRLYLASVLARSLDDILFRFIALDSAGELANDLDIGIDRARHIASDLNLDIELARARDRARGLDIDLAHHHARDRYFARDLDDLAALLVQARLRWGQDAEIDGALGRALYHVEEAKSSLDDLPLLNALGALAAAWQQKWGSRSASVSDQVSDAERSASLHLFGLPDLLSGLATIEDAPRFRARRMLEAPGRASALGIELLEALAMQAAAYAGEHSIGASLAWSLQEVEHDCPDWLADWLAQAAAPPEQFAPHSPAVELLGNIHKLTPEAAQVLLAVLPSVTPPVQGYLLASLSWLVRRDAWPEDLRPALLERLWSWLQDESDPNRRGQLLEVLGHWRWERPALAQHLLAGFHPTEEEEWVAYDMALARLAQWEPSLAKEIQFLLELALETQPQAAAPALARLLVFQNAREQTAEQLLDDLLNRLPKPPACLDALLEAGADDDIWNDRYHAFLSTAARQWIAGQAEESAAILLGQLGKRLRCVLSGDWPERRICLAVTTACAEALPSALQKACPDDLEALLVQGAVDPYCYDSRRFALTALSYLRTVTPAVIPALLAGCQDIAIVQRDAITAAGRFQYIEGDLLPELLPVLRGHSVSTAYAVAKLLASLSTSPGATSDLRQRIVAGLAEAIQDRESSQREVLLETQSSWSNEIKLESKGKLEETLYEALLQAAGWPV